jgi:UDP-N-acetyl-D-mannosaminuronic acid dehydrogenase
MHFKTLSMIGLGYIGLPTAALFASRGIKVIGVDVNASTVATINKGEIHIIEPDLDGIVHKAVHAGHLHATQTPEPADAFIIAVPTPFGEGHQPDLSYIKSAAEMIAPVLAKGNLVVLESTSPVGATEQMADWLAAARPDLSFPASAGEAADIQIAYCPERVLPGHVVRELVENDRIIGGLTAKASEMAVAMYKMVVQGDCVVTSARTAEMCKLTENSSRDVSIAFANELSVICDHFDINVWELIALANRHPRVNILQPGAGVGGHCIAVDPWFIVSSAGDKARMIKTARTINDDKPIWVVEKVKAAMLDLLSKVPSRGISDIKVACLGLAFKPNIDDLRESPALQIAQTIAQSGAQVLGVEPHISTAPDGITLASLADGLAQADVVVVLVKHSDFVTAKDDILQAANLIDVVGL